MKHVQVNWGSLQSWTDPSRGWSVHTPVCVWITGGLQIASRVSNATENELGGCQGSGVRERELLRKGTEDRKMDL